jgi:hypothetical protein
MLSGMTGNGTILQLPRFRRKNSTYLYRPVRFYLAEILHHVSPQVSSIDPFQLYSDAQPNTFGWQGSKTETD